jgi:tetratricopeptide (TPR) repeat protein
LSVLILIMLLTGGSPEPVATTTDTEAPDPPAPLEEVAEDDPPAPASALDEDDQNRLTDIEALPVYKRKLKDWLDLGALHTKRGDFEASTAAYRNAIQLDKTQAKNPVVVGQLRQAAEQRRSYEAAINVATTLLGEPGMDLLYDLWLSTRDDRKQRLLNDLAYKKLEILRMRGASEALRVRLDLEFAKRGECASVQKTLQRAIRHADRRSLAALEALRETSGCGASKKADCYPCLRGDDDLDLAIETAEQHPGPRFEDGKYVAQPD